MDSQCVSNSFPFHMNALDKDDWWLRIKDQNQESYSQEPVQPVLPGKSL